VFNNAASATGPTVVLATVLFSAQIYCDFSGYTDIATGCARILGIKLMKNFDRPYKARSIREFWRRWHISLTSWFTDYLYIPLGGSRRGNARRMINIMIVFLVSGLWHGARWTFVIWGGLHGLFQIVSHLTKKPREKFYAMLKINTESKLFALWQRFVTFALICFSWIFFRGNSFSDVGLLLGALLKGWGLSDAIASFDAIGFNILAAVAACLSVIVMSRLDEITEKAPCELESAKKGFITLAYLVWTVAVAWLLLLSVGGSSSFVYFQF